MARLVSACFINRYFGRYNCGAADSDSERCAFYWSQFDGHHKQYYLSNMLILQMSTILK